MKETRGVNLENVVKLLKFLKDREPIEVPLIKNNELTEEQMRSLDNKSENDYGDY